MATYDTLEATLLEQSGGLRALASALLGDEHGAEDVLQETWLRTRQVLAGRTGDPGADDAIRNPGGWLRRVTSRVALNHRRAEGRRSRHEERAARPEALEAARDTLAEREVMRRVIEAVLALDEPYQTVVVMRYYEDLAPREIARLRGVPVATVASQLHRGRALLRARLDDLHEGDGRVWAVLLAGALRADGSASAAPAGLVTAIAASVVVGGIVLFALSRSGAGVERPGAAALASLSPSEASAPSGMGEANETGASNTELTASAGNQDRTAVRPAGVPRVAPALAPDPHVFELALTVVDADDLPQVAAPIVLAPVDHPLNCVGQTDAEGRFVVRWRARSPRMEVDLGVVVGEQLDGGLLRIALDAGRPREMRLACGHASLLPQTLAIVAEDAAPAVEASLVSCAAPSARMRTDPPDRLVEALAWTGPDAEGMTRFAWPAHQLEEAMFEDITFGAEASTMQPEPPESAHVRGELRDAQGNTVGNAPIAVRSPGGLWEGWRVQRSEDDGSFDIELEPEGVVELRAGGGSRGLALHRIEFAREQPLLALSWNPVLERGNEVRGRIAPAAGLAALAWIVDCTLDVPNGTYADAASGLGGSFALPNLPRGSGRLELSHPAAWPFVVRTEAITAPWLLELALQVSAEDAGGGRIELAVATSAGEPEPGADVRLTQIASGRTAWLAYDAGSGRYVRSDVPTGQYRLAAGSALAGYQELGAVTIAHGETLVAGDAPLAAAGRLEVALAAESDARGQPFAWQVVRRNALLDLEVATFFGEPGELSLAPGEYLVLLLGEELAAVAARVAVVAGETARVELDPRAIGELVLAAAAAAEPGPASPFRLLRAGTEEVLYAHAVEPGQDLRLFLPAGGYRLRAGTLERDLEVPAGGTLRVEL